MPILYPPTTNSLSKQLASDFTSGGTVLTLNNATNIQNKAGVCVVNRIDTNGTLLTPSGRTYYQFTGTSGATLTGVTAVDGTDQDHATGEVVEFIADVTWGQYVADALANMVDASTLAVDLTKLVTPGGTQTLTNKTITSPSIGGTVAGGATYTAPTITTLKVTTAYSNGNLGATPTINWSNGDLQTGTLSANTTINFSNAAAGQRLTLFMVQDGTGTRTIAWTPTIVWQDGATWGTSYYTTTASAMNVVVIYYNGSSYYGMSGKFA